MKKKLLTNKVKTFLFWDFGLFIAIGSIGSLFAFLPDPHSPSIPGLLMVWAIALSISILGYFSYFKNNWYAACFGAFGISLLALAGAIHALGSVISSWYWSIPLVVAFIAAWLLPIFNPKFAKLIHNEQYSPQSPLGKGCLFFVLMIGGMSGAGGALVGIFSLRFTGSSNIAMFTIGVLFALISIGISQTFAYQMWDRRQILNRGSKNLRHGEAE